MPLYEYRCSKCDKIFEVIEKFADAPLTVHEGCGGRVERLLSAPAFQLKGTGWYATDYPKGGGEKSRGEKKDEKGANGASDSRDSKSSESKSDSTPAPSETKSESKPAPANAKKD